MRHAPSTLHFSHAYRPSAAAGGIEWEELPSLAGRVHPSANDTSATAGVWDATRPADFEPAAVSPPFREPLHGVAIREVTEPDVFRHFFGVAADR